MAISYTKYPIANVSEIEAALKTALESSGMYDSVTWSNSGEVYITKNSKTYVELDIGSTFGISIATDNITGWAYQTSTLGTAYVTISAIGNESVCVTIIGGWRCSVIFCKSKAGKNMVLLGIPTESNKYTPVAIAQDAASVTATPVDNLGIPYKWGAPVATTAGITAESVSETYATADAVYHLVKMPNTIAYPWINTTTDLVQLQIGGKNCITDGYFVCVDE